MPRHASAHVPRHARSPRRRWPKILAITLAAIVLIAGATVGGTLLWVRNQLDSIPTFPSGPGPVAGGQPASSQPRLTLPPALRGVTTFLIFTTGSRNMTPEDARRYGITDIEARGEDGLTDSIIVAVLDAPQRKLTLLSIPRDTWLRDEGSRINEVYNNHGASAFAEQVTKLTGVPINHMVAVNFTAAARLTDVVGGIDISIPVPTRDFKSHLLLPEAGCVHLDGRHALAFARSRHTQVKTDGQWHPDTSATDFGRSVRQQAVITAALDKVLSPALPRYLPGLASAARDTLIIDAGLNLGAVIDTAKVLATGPQLQIVHLGLPSNYGKVGQADVVFSDPRESRPILEQLVAEVPGATLPAWVADVPAATSSSQATPTAGTTGSGTPGSATPGARSGTPSASPSPSPTTTPVVVEGFDPGKNAAYRPCSDGYIPPLRPEGQG